MKVAITSWGNRISPVFDSSHMLLVAEIIDSTITDRCIEPFNSSMPLNLVNRLKELDVIALICGAITTKPAKVIEASGIKLIPFIGGNIDKVLQTYARDQTLSPKYLMPGCGKKRRKKGKKAVVSGIIEEDSAVPKKDGTRGNSQDLKTGKGGGRCKSRMGGRSSQPGQGQRRGLKGGRGRGGKNEQK